MNRTKSLGDKIGFVLCSALLGLGCTTYGQPSVSVGVSVPLPSVQISVESDFYEPLTPHGEWVVVGSYGRCWRPARVEAGWRPYCNGNWQRTEAGWYWASDEPWAWATYHYGRWDFTDQYGWYWVPQVQWAPAWVSWHSGGGYVGWAPLQPAVRVSASGYVGFNVALVSPRAFVFVEQRQFLDPIRPTTVVVNNTTIINKTVIIANTRIVNNTVINEGPDTTVIEKASGRKVQPVQVRELRQKSEAAVVAKPRTPAATTEKAVQPAARGGVETPEKKTVPEPTQVQKPAATTRGTVAPDLKNANEPTNPRKPVPAAVETKPTVKPDTKPAVVPEAKPAARPATRPEIKTEAKPEARPETKPAVRPEARPAAKPEAKPAIKPETKPEATSPAVRQPARRGATEQPIKTEKSTQPPDEKGQPPAKEQPGERRGGDPAADKDSRGRPKA